MRGGNGRSGRGRIPACFLHHWTGVAPLIVNVLRVLVQQEGGHLTCPVGFLDPKHLVRKSLLV